MFGNEEKKSRSSFWSCGCGDDNNLWSTTASQEHKQETVPIEDWTDSELAKEMNGLTVEERGKLLDEIHGVAQVQEETPDFINKCILEFDHAISDIPKIKRKSMERAMFLKPSLKNDKKFKLMFLRADCYKPKEAANRMTKYFTFKQKLFGEEKLAKDITIDDLDENDMKFFSAGNILELPHRDQVGRPIWFVDTKKIDWNNPTGLFRCSWYLMMSTVEDEVAQKKGICQVVYNSASSDHSVTTILSTMVKSGDLVSSVPCRIISSHQCFESSDDIQLKILSGIRMAYGKELRLRMKTHFGSPIEMQYSLLTYGIRCGKLLMQRSTSAEKQELFQAYLKRRMEIEKAQEQLVADEEARSGMISYPKPNDVLIGRGSPYHEYVGNLLFNRLIDTRLDRYRECDDNFGKTCISMEVVKSVEEYGGRFLQQEIGKGWKIADYATARQKASNAFRSKNAKAASGGDTVKHQPNVGVDDHQTKRQRYHSPSPGQRNIFNFLARGA